MCRHDSARSAGRQRCEVLIPCAHHVCIMYFPDVRPTPLAHVAQRGLATEGFIDQPREEADVAARAGTERALVVTTRLIGRGPPTVCE